MELAERHKLFVRMYPRIFAHIKKIAFGDNFRRFSQGYGKVLYTFLYHEK